MNASLLTLRCIVRRIVAGAFFASLIYFTPAHVGSASAAPHSAPTPVSVGFTQQSFTIYDNSTLRFVMEIRNAAGVAKPSESLSIEVILSKRIESRKAFVRATEEGVLPNPLDGLRMKTLDLEVNESGRFIIEIPTTPKTSTTDALYLGVSGIYPISFIVREGKTEIGKTTTYLHHISASDREKIAGGGALSVVPVVSITGSPATQKTGAVEANDEVRTEVSTFIQTFTGVGRGAFLAIQPDFIQALANSSIATDKTLLDDVRSLLETNTLSSFPYVPMNPSAAATANLNDAFATQLRAGEDSVTPLFALTPNRETMLVHHPLSAKGAALLRDLGVRNVILTPRAQRNLGSPLESDLVYRSRLTDGGYITVHGTDLRYAEMMSRADLSPLARATTIVAEMILQRGDAVRASEEITTKQVLFSSATGDIENVAVMRQLFRLLTLEPYLKLSNTPVIRSGETAPNPFALGAFEDPSLLKVTATIDKLATRMSTVGSMLSPADSRLSKWVALIAALPASTATEAQRGAYARAITADINRIRNAVSLPKSTNFTLSGRESALRLQIKNTSATSLFVVVQFRSAKITFPKNSQVVELVPNSSTEITVNVVARSNGRFPVAVQLYTPLGRSPLGSTVTITARVSALAGLGIVVSSMAVLILLTWWVHNWRRKRRREIEGANAANESTTVEVL